MRHLDKLLAPTAEALGYDIVRVTLVGSGRQTLQVMAERQGGEGMSVEDCEILSRSLSALLDVEDPIRGAYMLEVSSPGLDRPLTRPGDFSRFAGREARIETDRLIEGQRRFKGEILGIDDDYVIHLRRTDVTPDDEGGVERRIPFGAITKARLLLTDDMITQSLRQAKAAHSDAENDPGPTEDDRFR